MWVHVGGCAPGFQGNTYTCNTIPLCVSAKLHIACSTAPQSREVLGQTGHLKAILSMVHAYVHVVVSMEIATFNKAWMGILCDVHVEVAVSNMVAWCVHVCMLP